MSFHDVWGHEKQIEIFQKTLSQRRIGHAYLFSGIPAVGKKTLARELAKAFNCQEADAYHNSCGKCPSCRKIERGSHPDYFCIEAEGQFIRINAIRQIQEHMNFKPLEAQYRVFIIDDADKMNDQAANALLKTLEEPSPVNVLILVTSRPYSLPATILSRCRHIRFNPLTANIIAKFLIDQRGIEKQKAVLLANLSNGSIGQALELNNEDVIAYRNEIFEMLANTKNTEPFSLIAFASFLAQNKKGFKMGLYIVGSCFRDALIFKETRKSQMLINQDKAFFVEALAMRLSGEQILQNIMLVEKAEKTIEHNGNKLLTLETMAFKLKH